MSYTIVMQLLSVLFGAVVAVSSVSAFPLSFLRAAWAMCVCWAIVIFCVCANIDPPLAFVIAYAVGMLHIIATRPNGEGGAWLEHERRILCRMHGEGIAPAVIAYQLGRTEGAIRYQIRAMAGTTYDPHYDAGTLGAYVQGLRDRGVTSAFAEAVWCESLMRHDNPPLCEGDIASHWSMLQMDDVMTNCHKREALRRQTMHELGVHLMGDLLHVSRQRIMEARGMGAAKLKVLSLYLAHFGYEMPALIEDEPGTPEPFCYQMPPREWLLARQGGPK